MDADDARRMLLLVPKFIELPPHSRAVEALSLKGAFQENFPYLFPQNDVSLEGNNLDFLGVCEVEGPIEASSNDPREAFGIVCADYSVELLARQARIRKDDLPLIIAIDVGNCVAPKRADKINFPSAPCTRTFATVRFQFHAKASRAVTTANA